MRRIAFLGMFLAACASSQQSSGPPVEITLVQQNLPPDVYYFAGPIGLQYQLIVNNPTSQPITLRRVDLYSEGQGAYSINTSGVFNLTVPANTTARQMMYAWGRAYGGMLNAGTPVTMRVTGVFDDASGKPFTKVALQNLPQQ